MRKKIKRCLLRLRLLCDLVTKRLSGNRHGSKHLNSHRAAATLSKRGHQRALHDATIAALSVGSGLGVHFADSSAPFVASAGVLAAAAMSRYTYGLEIDQVREELQAVQSHLAALSEQFEADRHNSASRLAWVANVSHEIRSPLSAVVALGDMLQHSGLAPDQKSLVRDIQEAGHMVLGVINDTLDLAKAESGQLSLVTRPFSLQALCDRVGRLGQALAFGRQRPAQIAVTAAPVDWVVGDELRLQQVLLNLVSNAIKYSPQGAIEVACRCEEERADGVVLLRFSVSDHGRGLSEQEQARLFTPYSRLAGGDREPDGGTGLGLYLCQQIIRLMGGHIGVNSQLGQGSQFWFRVPLARETSAFRSPGVAEPTPLSGPGAGQGCSLENRVIAVVDDSRLSREVAQRIVRAEGGTCLAFSSGEAFLERLRMDQPRIDAVLMDLDLPGMDGFAACEALRRIEGLEQMPVVAVSGTEVDGITSALEHSGLQAHVLKPFHASTLVGTIVKLLA